MVTVTQLQANAISLMGKHITSLPVYNTRTYRSGWDSYSEDKFDLGQNADSGLSLLLRKAYKTDSQDELELAESSVDDEKRITQRLPLYMISLLLNVTYPDKQTDDIASLHYYIQGKDLINSGAKTRTGIFRFNEYWIESANIRSCSIVDGMLPFERTDEFRFQVVPYSGSNDKAHALIPYNGETCNVLNPLAGLQLMFSILRNAKKPEQLSVFAGNHIPSTPGALDILHTTALDDLSEEFGSMTADDRIAYRERYPSLD